MLVRDEAYGFAVGRLAFLWSGFWTIVGRQAKHGRKDLRALAAESDSRLAGR